MTSKSNVEKQQKGCGKEFEDGFDSTYNSPLVSICQSRRLCPSCNSNQSPLHPKFLIGKDKKPVDTTNRNETGSQSSQNGIHTQMTDTSEDSQTLSSKITDAVTDGQHDYIYADDVKESIKKLKEEIPQFHHQKIIDKIFGEMN